MFASNQYHIWRPLSYCQTGAPIMRGFRTWTGQHFKCAVPALFILLNIRSATAGGRVLRLDPNLQAAEQPNSRPHRAGKPHMHEGAHYQPSGGNGWILQEQHNALSTTPSCRYCLTEDKTFISSFPASCMISNSNLAGLLVQQFHHT